MGDSERCAVCGAETDGTAAAWSVDDEGTEAKWPLCHSGRSATCPEKWRHALMVARTFIEDTEALGRLPGRESVLSVLRHALDAREDEGE